MLCVSDIIPKQFHRSSGLTTHCFKVSKAEERQWRKGRQDWPCLFKRNDKWQKVLVPISEFPDEVEAIAILSYLDGETERKGRYINVHSAYEAVVKNRAVELSAIRHALAHPVTSLTRPNVRLALDHHFRGQYIDLTRHTHKKVFYTCIAQMLIAIDITLTTTFNKRWKELIV